MRMKKIDTKNLGGNTTNNKVRNCEIIAYYALYEFEAGCGTFFTIQIFLDIKPILLHKYLITGSFDRF